MIPTARIATGFAESLLKSARPSTDPELIVAEAVQRGLRLRPFPSPHAHRLSPARPSLREGGAPWPVTIAHPKPSSGKPKRRASQPTSSSNANAPQAAATHATATRRYGARPHGGATSTPPPTPQASWTWSGTGCPGRAPRRIGAMRSQCLISRGQRSPLHALKARRNLESSSGFLLPPVTVQFQILTPGSRANMIRPSLPHHNLQPPDVPSAFRRGRISSRATQPVLSV